jgi:hypothetical protein
MFWESVDYRWKGTDGDRSRGDVKGEGHEDRDELVKGTAMRYKTRCGREGESGRIWLDRRTGCEELVEMHNVYGLLQL